MSLLRSLCCLLLKFLFCSQVQFVYQNFRVSASLRRLFA